MRLQIDRSRVLTHKHYVRIQVYKFCDDGISVWRRAPPKFETACRRIAFKVCARPIYAADVRVQNIHRQQIINIVCSRALHHVVDGWR